MENLYELINKYLLVQEDKEDVFGVLHFVQSKLGYIPKEIQEYIADKMDIDYLEVAKIIEISSYFEEKVPVIKVAVCSGISCTMKGSRFVLEELSKKLNVKVDDENSPVLLTTKKCFAACNYGVNVEVNGELIHEVTVSKLDEVLEKIKIYY